MATRKAGGSTQLGRDSRPKYLGVKRFGGQKVKVGEILVRQRGSGFRAGKNTKITKDDTIIAVKDGVVKFVTKKIVRFTGTLKKAKFIEVE
ncbi:MAG TPA: 50S ribosomal protein L27 [Candidatus Moranbacteria bacterium]|nr:50S ribosomal protein L27 [Candidatus Moranbacteria bacterium]